MSFITRAPAPSRELQMVAELAGIPARRLQAAMQDPAMFRQLALSGEAYRVLAALDKFKVIMGRIVEMADTCLPAEVRA